MRQGAALGAWLHDPGAQAQTAQRNAAARASLPGFDRLQALAARLDGLGEGADEDRLAAVDGWLDPFFADDHWVEALVAALVRAAAADPFFEPPFRALGGFGRTGFLLLDHAELQLRLLVIGTGAVVRGGGDPVAFSGLRSRLRFCRAGGARLGFWRSESGAGKGAVDANCRRIGGRTVRDGTEFRLDGRSEAITIDASSATVVLLKAQVRIGCGALRRDFDRATGAPVAAIAAEDAASRVQMLLTLARMQGRTDAAPVFAQATSDPAFFVRWYAMREFLALDPQCAIPRLIAMAREDPHAEVRDAATATVATLEVRYPELFALALGAATDSAPADREWRRALCLA